MAAAAAAETTGPAPAKEDLEKKVELMKEIRAHEVAIAELQNLHPSRAVYQKAGNIFFRKSVKSVVTREQSMPKRQSPLMHCIFLLLLVCTVSHDSGLMILSEQLV
ncbi:hypothetical protein PVAP13_2KG063400 [Panicum virgatum]|uniref:Uncharacterized protein n=1 Tax=Panicum virgatum TaxID=38727 RepID=A0A8T0W052_PANVG|nr:hypothetical protein PVAP13_2KG063400 [Panicum virgatum]